MAALPGAAFIQSSRDPELGPWGTAAAGPRAGARPAAGVGGPAAGASSSPSPGTGS